MSNMGNNTMIKVLRWVAMPIAAIITMYSVKYFYDLFEYINFLPIIGSGGEILAPLFLMISTSLRALLDSIAVVGAVCWVAPSHKDKVAAVMIVLRIIGSFSGIGTGIREMAINGNNGYSWVIYFYTFASIAGTIFVGSRIYSEYSHKKKSRLKDEPKLKDDPNTVDNESVSAPVEKLVKIDEDDFGKFYDMGITCLQESLDMDENTVYLFENFLRDCRNDYYRYARNRYAKEKPVLPLDLFDIVEVLMEDEEDGYVAGSVMGIEFLEWKYIVNFQKPISIIAPRDEVAEAPKKIHYLSPEDIERINNAEIIGTC